MGADVRRAEIVSRIGIIALIERKVAVYLPNCVFLSAAGPP